MSAAHLREQIIVGVERMGGEIEAQDLELAMQLLRGEPRRIGRKRYLLGPRRGPRAEHVALAAHLVFLGALPKPRMRSSPPMSSARS